MRWLKPALIVGAVAGCCLAVEHSQLQQQQIHLNPLKEGIRKRIGGVPARAAETSETPPATLRVKPRGDLKSPLYGVMPVGFEGLGRVFHVVVDTANGDPSASKLWVDANGNGDLTDDPPAEWAVKPYVDEDDHRTYQNHEGAAVIDIGTKANPFPARFRFVMYDPAMKGFEAAEKRRLVFMADYGRSGKADIGGKTYDVVLTDWFGTGDFSRQVDLSESGSNRKSLVILMVDRNGNGRFDGAAEKFSTTQPFTIAGQTYEVRDVTPLGDSLRIVPSTQKAVEIPVPADVRKGQVVPSFEAKTTNGQTVRFPRDYKGKIVLLDFWATWCGPCVGSVPELVQTYDTWHPKGFDILGVSLDREGDADKLRAFTLKHHMPWPQLFDGKAWDGERAHTFGVDSIPRVFLVDGTTGKILAEEADLREQSLEAVVRAAIEKK